MAKKLQNSSGFPSLQSAFFRDILKKKERKGSSWKHTNIGGAVLETYKGISRTSFYRDLQQLSRWNVAENF